MNIFSSDLQAYVSCALGIPSVGYVMICFGVVNAICSLLFGTIMKYIGRLPLMALGLAVHSTLIWILIVWRPHPNNPKLFFTISGLWGVGDAIWQTQMSGKSLLLTRHKIIYLSSPDRQKGISDTLLAKMTFLHK